MITHAPGLKLCAAFSYGTCDFFFVAKKFFFFAKCCQSFLVSCDKANFTPFRQLTLYVLTLTFTMLWMLAQVKVICHGCCRLAMVTLLPLLRPREVTHPKLRSLTGEVKWTQVCSDSLKARYGGSNMKKINNGGRLLIFYMMEGIKKVNWKNGILWLFSVTDPPKIQDGLQI